MFSPVALVALLSALTPWASAQSATPAAPGLTFLYSLNCTLAPAYEMGYGPKGVRVAIPITGGTFSGPRLNGKPPSFFSIFCSKNSIIACTPFPIPIVIDIQP